ncbi:MAG: RNA-directed DNA polymerase, partial [Sphingobacteriia bacterium]|nr:RNA-directed DNA polymerase [Sphingobacteriia bacterium]
MITDNIQFITDLFAAYYNARQNKRNTINQLKFELNFEREIFKLYNEIETRTYKPLRETAFIINKPLKREIFAADFRDRVVHHLLFGYISPIIEKYLIYDCYSCRRGKGTNAGIRRAASFLRSCSENYQKDCYVMQMDISGYFMSINRELLYHKVNGMLQREYRKCALSGKIIPFDASIVDFLLQKTIFRNPADNCVIKGSRSDWDGLPANKSLFYASEGYGLPIGNLTSQLFGNVFLNDFDRWMKQNMGFRHYGRYVDDFFVIYPDKLCLLSALPKIADYLKVNEKLTLHPDKTKINHYKLGFLFLGAYIKPYRIYIANRIKGSFCQALEKQNKIIRRHKPTDEEKNQFIG